MFDKRINIKSVRVELTTKRQQYIIRHIGPLLRLTSDDTAKIEVIIRPIQRPFTGTTCCVMVRIAGKDGAHYAVSMSPFFTRAVRDVRDEMRRTLSRTYTPDTKTIEQFRQQAHERYFVELFI